MNFPILVLVVSFVILLALNVPVAFCMGIASMLAIAAMGGLPAFTAGAPAVAQGQIGISISALTGPAGGWGPGNSVTITIPAYLDITASSISISYN